VTVYWFGPQNQAGYALSVAPQNRWEDEDGAGHASRSSGLLRVKASRARVSQFASKPAEARRQVVHVALSWRLRRIEVEDGQVDTMSYVGPCYRYFAVFFVLCRRGILVRPINRTLEGCNPYHFSIFTLHFLNLECAMNKFSF
jgi:hypothetical protein